VDDSQAIPNLDRIVSEEAWICAARPVRFEAQTLIESARKEIRFEHPENELGVSLLTGKLHRAIEQCGARAASST